jgi:hypothetical protein
MSLVDYIAKLPNFEQLQIELFHNPRSTSYLISLYINQGYRTGISILNETVEPSCTPSISRTTKVPQPITDVLSKHGWLPAKWWEITRITPLASSIVSSGSP